MENPQSIKNKEIFKDFISTLWEKRELDQALNFLADDISYYGVRNEFHGKENYRKMLEGYLSTFHDVSVDMVDMVSENNKLYLRGSLKGIMDGEFEGIKATNKKVSVNFFNEVEVENGKIKNDWDLIDELGLMQQLGMELRPSITVS